MLNEACAGEGAYVSYYRAATVSIVIDVGGVLPNVPAILSTFDLDGRERSNVEVILTTSLIGSSDLSSLPINVKILNIAGTVQSYRWDEAAKVCSGSVLVFFDCEWPPKAGWLEQVVRRFIDPRIGLAVGPIDWGGDRGYGRVLSGYLGRYCRTNGSGRLLNLTTGDSGLCVTSTSFAFRSEVFKRVGGFQSPTDEVGPWERAYAKVTCRDEFCVVVDSSLSQARSTPESLKEVLSVLTKVGNARGSLYRHYPQFQQGFRAFGEALRALIVILGLPLAYLYYRYTQDISIAKVVLFTYVMIAIVYCVGAFGRLRRSRTQGVYRLLCYFLCPISYVVAFCRGFLGPDLGMVSPPSSTSKVLRVLIINWRDTTHPWAGGAENYVYQIVRDWNPEEVAIEWLTQRHRGSAKDDVVDGVRVHRVGGRFTLYLRVPIKYLVSLRGRYDIVVDCENGIPFFVPLYSKVPVVLLVHHVHQEIFRTQLPRYLSWIGVVLEGYVMPRVYKNCRVVAVSNGTKSDLLELGFHESKVEVIKNGVFTPNALCAPKSLLPTVFCMGRLKQQKSVDVLIKAVPYLLSWIGPIQVDILGQGPDRSRLEGLVTELGINEYVRFHGYVSSVIRDQLATQAWVAVCPSSFEGWGVVCMEASARALPVVASNVPGLNESVRDGDTGVLFPHGDSHALALALLDLLSDAEKRRSMGDAGRIWAQAHSWITSSERFLELLRLSVGRSREVAPYEQCIEDFSVNKEMGSQLQDQDDEVVPQGGGM